MAFKALTATEARERTKVTRSTPAREAVRTWCMDEIAPELSMDSPLLEGSLADVPEAVVKAIQERDNYGKMTAEDKAAATMRAIVRQINETRDTDKRGTTGHGVHAKQDGDTLLLILADFQRAKSPNGKVE